MKTVDIRQKYIDFFKVSPRSHQEIDPAPLVLEDDPTTLFTSSGMQPLVPYLLGQQHPNGKRLVNSQPSIRTQDIDEVGDNRHTTFFEMLGNWSLGDYFKKEQLPWIYEFLTKELGLDSEKLWFSVFEGDKDFGVPEDKESVEIWKKIGVSQKRIIPYGVKKNWWSRTGTPTQMPIGDIGGPTSEIFYDFGKSRKIHETSKYAKEKCHPNCDCGRFLEIGNNVFMEYKKINEKEVEPLPNKNIDFGGGLERIAAAVNDDPDIFNTQYLSPIVDKLQSISSSSYVDDLGSFRLVADHLRASVFLIANGVVPSNKQQGYILRRLLRKAVMRIKYLGIDQLNVYEDAVGAVFDIYKNVYFKNSQSSEIVEIIKNESDKLNEALEKGKKMVDKVSAFDLYQSFGLPPEVIEELYIVRGLKLQRKKLEIEIRKHKEKSRTTSKGMFKGGLADHSDEVVRLHTAAHLLHASLRELLDESVLQKGQNITKERLRFDVSHNQKLSDMQLKEVENSINQKINEGLPVKQKMMSRKDAEKSGAIGLFTDKYSDEVSIHFIGDSLEGAYSKEFCGGPHVKNTNEIGRVRIKKQEKVGANMLRLYVVSDN